MHAMKSQLRAYFYIDLSSCTVCRTSWRRMCYPSAENARKCYSSLGKMPVPENDRIVHTGMLRSCFPLFSVCLCSVSSLSVCLSLCFCYRNISVIAYTACLYV